MDGELVSSSPFDSLQEGEPQGLPSESYTYTEKFEEAFPYYLAIGMTYEQFWDMDCELVKYYRKAEKLKRNAQIEDLNFTCWLQGMYFYEALCDVSPVLHAMAKAGARPHPYAKDPYPITQKQSERKEKSKEKVSYEKALAKMNLWMARINNKNSKQGGENNV